MPSPTNDTARALDRSPARLKIAGLSVLGTLATVLGAGVAESAAAGCTGVRTPWWVLALVTLGFVATAAAAGLVWRLHRQCGRWAVPEATLMVTTSVVAAMCGWVLYRVASSTDTWPFLC